MMEAVCIPLALSGWLEVKSRQRREREARVERRAVVVFILEERRGGALGWMRRVAGWWRRVELNEGKYR